MKPKDKYFIIVGIIICLIIVVMTPFIASKNPDGLQKTTEQLNTNEESVIYKAPFVDYKIPLFGNGPYSVIAALIVGLLIVLGFGYLAAQIIKRKKPPESS